MSERPASSCRMRYCCMIGLHEVPTGDMPLLATLNGSLPAGAILLPAILDFDEDELLA